MEILRKLIKAGAAKGTTSKRQARFNFIPTGCQVTNLELPPAIGSVAESFTQANRG